MPSKFISILEKTFAVTFSDLNEIINNFHDEMKLGLSGKKSSLKMIPSFVGRAKGVEKGRYLALDLGGTNLRVLAVDLDGKGKITIAAVSKFVIKKELMTGKRDPLFDFIAQCVLKFLIQNSLAKNKHYSLGFTFSFPVEQTSIDSGKLIKWTKGFNTIGVKGKDVVALLLAAFKRAGLKSIMVTALANDTVGTLVAKSYTNRFCDMGLILGTGTNACYLEKAAKITKITKPKIKGEMIINMEWGNFSKLRLNQYDKELDKNSQNKGHQYLEKTVSGMYLGELTRRIVLNMASKGLILSNSTLPIFLKPYSFRTEEMSAIASGKSFIKGLTRQDMKILKKICEIVSLRAARVAGAAIAAVITWMDPELKKTHTIGIDGALFEKYPGFESNIKNVFNELFKKQSKNITLEMAKDGSGIGAAVIAAIATSN